MMDKNIDDKVSEILASSGFEVSGFLGKGVWSRVYLVNEHNKKRALKLLFPSHYNGSSCLLTNEGIYAPDKELYGRFATGLGSKEANYTDGFFYKEHVLVKRLFEPSEFLYSEKLNTVFFTMPYYKGSTLPDFVDGEIDRNICRVLMQNIEKDLDHLHSNNILHRDLSESNVLVLDNQEARVIDFSVAIHCEGECIAKAPATSREGRPWLAPEYVHPQRGLTRQSFDSDKYALGYLRNYLESFVRG
ncbi:MAG: protein kinase domain-containing protein [Nanobdellota archaeon]